MFTNSHSYTMIYPVISSSSRAVSQSIELILKGTNMCIQNTSFQQIISFQKDKYTIDWIYNNSELKAFSIYKRNKRIFTLASHESQLRQFQSVLNGQIRVKYICKNFQISRCLKQSQNSKILLGMYDNDLKILKLIDKEQCQNEMDILLHLKKQPHPNLQCIHSYSIEGNQYAVLMDYCTGGTLYTLQNRYSNKIPLSVVKHLMLQILEGIYHLHSLNIIHRDIKYDNILIQSENSHQVIIIDYGLSTKYSDNLIQQVGTLGYIAPEIFKRQPVTNKCDIFSLGVVFHKLLTDKGIFQNLEENITGNYEINEQIRNPSIRDLLTNMLKKDPSQRYSAEDCLSHPYFIDEENTISQQISIIESLSPKPKVLSQNNLDPMTIILN